TPSSRSWSASGPRPSPKGVRSIRSGSFWARIVVCDMGPATRMAHSRLLCLLALVALTWGCADGLRKFPDQDPIWVDDDQQPFAPVPEEYFSPFGWDAADNTFFRPLAKFFAADPGGEA